MARRHERLIPLTHDHHHALHYARQLRKGADGDDNHRQAVAAEFIAFFRNDGVRHFRQEEEDLFPRVIDAPDSPIDGIKRALIEHVQIHAQVKELERQSAQRAVDADLMRDMAKRFREHVRFEENELFPAIESAAAAKLG